MLMNETSRSTITCTPDACAQFYSRREKKNIQFIIKDRTNAKHVMNSILLSKIATEGKKICTVYI